MKIRPRNNILYAATGVKFSSANAGGANWRQLVFNNYRQHLLDLLTKYGEANDYGEWLNEMQHRHSQLYNAANQSGNWEDIAYENEDVGKYQQDYRGGKGNNGNYLRFGTILLNPEDNYDFNQTGIKTNLATRYNIPDPPRRVSGDFSRKGYDYRVDNYYSGITDDRRLLGRKGDWDENSQEYKDWLKELNSRGWTMELDPSDQYYKLKRLGAPQGDQIPSGELPDVVVTAKRPQTSVPIGHQDHYGFDWNKIKNGLSKIVNNPDLYALGRLAGNLYNNERVYDELLKGINPALKLTYNTHRQVVGDEATKQAYYRRAAAGQTKASRPFTSDADRQMAYLMEARRVGDELRALGDLADNAEIRRTSDESNQHQWANTQRATEVANYNNAAINLANALKHNLLALKHSALWSSVDNFLKGVEYRKRQQLAELQALDDQIFSLLLNQELANDSRIISGQKALQSVLDKHKNSDGTYNYDNEEVKNAIRNWKSLQTQIAIESYRKKLEYYRNRNLVTFSKSGTKITHKKKDDLLYKSARDVVEHFRKMSKLSSDALNRKKPKIEKLTPHPGSSRRKYQQGGVAPFTVYTPVALGGETSTSTQTSTSSARTSAKSGDDETLNMIKELFKLVAGKGLPSDVNRLYMSMQNFLSRAKAFGEDISTEDIASMYLSQMLELNRIEYLKNNFDKAKEVMISNDAVNEFAVDALGRIAALNKDGEIQYASSLADAQEKGLTPLTNGQIADLRSLVPSLAGRTDLDAVLANGIGMSKIASHIKSLIPTIGTDKLTLEGYTKVQAGQILKGFEQLLNAPDGDYLYEKSTETLKRQREAALGYITSMLPKNMKAVLKANADLQGVSPGKILESLIMSGDSTSLSLTFTPVTGKAAKDSNGNSKSGSGELKLDAATAAITGKGYQSEIELNIGSSYSVKVLGRFSEFLKTSGENLGAGISMKEATTSTLSGVLDWNKATIGGSRIIPTAYDQVILNNGEVAGVDLPVDPSNPNVPDFERLKQLENLDKQLRLNGIEDNELNRQKVNELCVKLGIPPKYDLSGNLNKTSWKRFAAFLVTTPDTALVNKNVILDMVGIAGKDERELYNSAMKQITKDKNFELSDKFLFFGHRDELYKGTVFVPIKESIVAAAISGGQNIGMSQATDLELRERGYDLSKVSLYKKPEFTL